MTHPGKLLKKYQSRAQKRYGQHFLASEGVVRKICAAADLSSESRVLEIGPGLGVLTEALLERSGRVVAMELDPDMVEVLKDRFGERDNFELHQQDAARIEDWAALLPGSDWALVANLPYNVGTGIVTQLLKRPGTFSRLVVMLQKEVAERMLAPEGHRKRGSLSVYCQARAEVSKVTRAPPGAFHPPPKVDSWVIQLDLFSSPQTDGVDPDLHERVVQAAFSAPRKAIRNGLSSRYERARVDRVLEVLEIDSRLRPAAVSAAQWNQLAAALEGDDPCR